MSSKGDKQTPELLLPIKTPGYRDNAQCPTEVDLDTPGGAGPWGGCYIGYIGYIGYISSPTTTTTNINFYADYSTDNRSGLDCDPWCWSPQHRVHMACT